MDQDAHAQRRSSIAVGIVLIAVGVAFLIGQQLRFDWLDVGWPLFIIGPGIALLVIALAVGGKPGAGFAVPGGIVTMTGLVLAVQNATGLWETWAYAWALVAPGGVGVGLLLYGLLTRQREFASSGGSTLLVALGLFLGFAIFFEGIIGLSGPRLAGIETWLAAGLIVLGVVLVLMSLVRSRTTT